MRAASCAAAASGSVLETGGVPQLPSFSAAGVSCGWVPTAPAGMPAPGAALGAGSVLAACASPLASHARLLLAGCAAPLLLRAGLPASGLGAPAGMLSSGCGGTGGIQPTPSCIGLSRAASMRASSSSGRIQARLCPSKDLYLGRSSHNTELAAALTE